MAVKKVYKNDMSRETLRELRIKKNYSQEELAKLVGISRTQYCLFETGKRTISIDVAQKLQMVLNCSKKDLFEVKGD